MSAVIAQWQDHPGQRQPGGGIELTAQSAGQDALLTPAALEFLAVLHRRFEPARQARLAARKQRQAFFDAGGLPDFRDDTAAIRNAAWRVAPLPTALLDRRVEITGPVDPKMVINALNSGAKVYMADFEDSTAPTWANLLTGQRSLRKAVAGTLDWSSPDGAKHYTLKPFEEQAVLMVRPRGWHLDEKHVRIDGAPMSGSLFDLGLFAFHNAQALAALDRGPYFYLPKLQSMEEAQLWNEVIGHVESELGLTPGQIKVTVLIETLPAVFEMDEILHALRTRIAGLNCGRWDYVFSYIKTFRAHRDKVLPERGQVTMTQPFLRAYSELLIQTCHKRGAHAMGGMAAQIPISGDEAANEAALAKVRADKLREVTAGHDGTWVAHPALIPLAMRIFDERMPTPHQQHVLREDVLIIREDLIKPSFGTITRAGFEGSVEVCVRYLAAWLEGNGCVPIHWLMEDAATAEIARTQLWQWLHADGLFLDDGTPLDFALLERALIGLPSKLADRSKLPGGSKLDEAIAMLDRLTHADTLEEFLTLPAYERID
ncbi:MULTISPECIES: malate synthase A [unclassified Lysobacter]|uniref:malate synthase A n=1 Tax=unclassified Lysobacter TaxID=2635362 RepID=UPI001BE87378|nr:MULTISPECIES: malate synthase A [unclassified Lysobacter]MBT2745675.1 malate synthase A [Lysobacter sp. ISL-42]MBT2749766.1 malate synthase A [Lysobacter sp. ISL-50]MBT2777515.1 malate synthase A [Lysobacter sp. ISL-54]MBT2782003.1 malate synthase A [Lysobacter sp. ISL-52]